VRITGDTSTELVGEIIMIEVNITEALEMKLNTKKYGNVSKIKGKFSSCLDQLLKKLKFISCQYNLALQPQHFPSSLSLDCSALASGLDVAGQSVTMVGFVSVFLNYCWKIYFYFVGFCICL
jgi:hypothetical protein